MEKFHNFFVKKLLNKKRRIFTICLWNYIKKNRKFLIFNIKKKTLMSIWCVRIHEFMRENNIDQKNVGYDHFWRSELNR